MIEISKLKHSNSFAFSMIEVLIAIFVMSVALLSFFSINQSSNSKSMDSYYEFLAGSLGEETINFCRGMGADWAIGYMKLPKNKQDIFPLGRWCNCKDKPICKGCYYFRECSSFERKVVFKPVKKDGETGVLVNVLIRTVKNKKARSWLSRDSIAFSTLLEKAIKR